MRARCASPALAFMQVNPSELAALHLNTRVMGRFGEGIQAPLRRSLLIAGLQGFGRRVVAPGQLAHLALFSFIYRCLALLAHGPVWASLCSSHYGLLFLA